MEIGMIVIPPIQITAGMLTSSIAEPDASVGEVSWNAATNYTTGTRVIRTTTHKVYERASPGGTDAGLPEVTSSKWVEIGPTNKWAMFDYNRSSISVANSTLTVTISLAGTSKRANSFAILNSNAYSVQVTGTNAGNTIFTQYYDLTNDRLVTNYYDYFFEPFRNKSNLIYTLLPPSLNNIYTFTFTLPNSGRVGGIVLGNSVFLGDIQRSPSIEQLNFSKIDRDDFGTSILIPRRSVPKTSQRTIVHKNSVNRLLDLRKELNAVPAVWSGLVDPSDKYFDALVIYGVYKEFSFNMEYPDHTTVDIQLEEV